MTALIWILLLPAIAAVIAPFAHRVLPRATPWLLAATSAAVAALVAAQTDVIASGGGIRVAWDWVPTLGVRMALALDGLAAWFALLIAGIGALVVIYAGAYLADHPALGRFYLHLMAFQTAMLGVVLADDLITLFVFWELTSITSYLLVGFDHANAAARTAALRALLVTGGGGLAMLIGFVLIGDVVGSFSITDAIASGETLRADPRYLAILALVLAGAFSKSAQVPLHFWLPGAMAAPTPVSAYLHSATMVKAGVYLLLRLSPGLGNTRAFTIALVVTGSLTLLFGGLAALRERDLKRILAATTVASLGMLVLLIGLGTSASLKAAVVFVLVHALYKGTLFLCAGNLEHATGTRDVSSIAGLRRAMPWTAAAVALATLSMAGLPPLLGFVGKELAYKAKLAVPSGDWLVPAIAVLGNAVLVAVALRLVAPFGRGALRSPHPPHEAPWSMRIGPLVLAALGLVLGVVPDILVDRLAAPAVAAVVGSPYPVHLGPWFGWGAALALSAVTVVLGVGIYRWRAPLSRGLDWLTPRRGFTEWWDRGVSALPAAAAVAVGRVQHGRLPAYLALTWLISMGGVGLAMVGSGLELTLADETGVPFLWPLVVLLGVASVAAAVTRSHAVAILALGVVGFGVGVLYVLFGAPDLALTQFLVESLVVLFLVLAVRRWPATAVVRGPAARRRLGHALIALTAGATLTLIILAVASERPLRTTSDYFVTRSVPDGQGHNVVNVILVDFRALDTLGEITVLALAAIGVALLLGRAHPPLAPAAPRAGGDGAIRSLILRKTAQVLVPLMLGYAAWLLWRGHNAPGGGFIAGLVTSAALILHSLAQGVAAMRRAVRVSPLVLAGLGLAIAVASALVAPLAGATFMTGLWIEPLAGLKLGTPLLFDVGVAAVVTGVLVTIYQQLEEAI